MAPGTRLCLARLSSLLACASKVVPRWRRTTPSKPVCHVAGSHVPGGQCNKSRQKARAKARFAVIAAFQLWVAEASANPSNWSGTGIRHIRRRCRDVAGIVAGGDATTLPRCRRRAEIVNRGTTFEDAASAPVGDTFPAS
ncbi:unnamed protein product [Ixodes pacificus]